MNVSTTDRAATGTHSNNTVSTKVEHKRAWPHGTNATPSRTDEAQSPAGRLGIGGICVRNKYGEQVVIESRFNFKS